MARAAAEAAAAAAAAVVPRGRGCDARARARRQVGVPRRLCGKAGGYCAVYKGTYVGKKPTAAVAALLYATHKAAAEYGGSGGRRRGGGGDEVEEEADFEAAALARGGWRAEGREVGRQTGPPLLRRFDKPSAGVIVRRLPADGDDEALWHMVHEDGDEEELDEKEVKEALRNEAEVRGRRRRSAPKSRRSRGPSLTTTTRTTTKTVPLSRKRQKNSRGRTGGRAARRPLPTPPAAARRRRRRRVVVVVVVRGGGRRRAALSHAPRRSDARGARCAAVAASASLDDRAAAPRGGRYRRLPRAELASATGLIVKLRAQMSGVYMLCEVLDAEPGAVTVQGDPDLMPEGTSRRTASACSCSSPRRSPTASSTRSR